MCAKMVQESLAAKQAATTEKTDLEKFLDTPMPQECSTWNTDDASRNACLAKHSQDLQFAIDNTLRKKAQANGFNYSALAQQKTKEEIAREKFYTVLIWLGGCLFFIFILYVLFRIIKNKLSLRIKRRAGKHTLDDVFAAEKKD